MYSYDYLVLELLEIYFTLFNYEEVEGRMKTKKDQINIIHNNKKHYNF